MKEMLKKILASGGLNNELSCEIEELLAQPEQEPTTRHALDSYWNQEAYQRGYAEAKLKLKREPLSDEAIMKIWEDTFYEGHNYYARAIEKAHGIGGGE
jgi:hypothetical protein